ncbi:hypothetical protein [Brevibacillus porteri]|uniref:hypothetical protein n=1 Tax=Brevibacillus porteri TaxID=2126350 RepID=UPI003D1CC5C9
MALVPLKQTVTITPIVRDEWERDVEGTPFQLRCRIQEGTKLVRSSSGASGVSGITAQEVVSVARIYFDKYPKIGYADKITHTDEHGNTIDYRPLNIAVKRGLNGKAILTEVSV